MQVSVHELQYDYEILLCEDLATITCDPSTVYQQLQSVYQPTFDNQQRIVYFTKYQPSTELLDHLHRAMEVIGISGSFVILCCDHAVDINKYADPIVINRVTGTRSDPLESNFNLPDKFCPLPWMHLELRHNSDISPCCVSTDIVGSASTDDLRSVLNNKKMSQLREDFLSGQQPAGCQHCWRIEDQGQISNRQFHKKYLAKKFHLQYAHDLQIRSLDVKPGNVCNFKCRICNPTSSSLYADEARKFNHNKTFAISPQQEYNDYIWNQFTELLPTIENLDFYGGEPFLVKKIATLLKEAVDKDYANRIRVTFNSNGSIYPEETIDLLEQFRSVDIALSIDNIGKRFELERGGVWTEVEQNILRFRQLESDKMHVHLWPTVNIQNIYYLDEIFAWAEQHSIDVNLNFLDGPDWANIESLTTAAITLIANKYQDSKIPQLQELSRWVKTFKGNTGEEFVRAMKKFDQIRSQDFAASHPEIAHAMGY